MDTLPKLLTHQSEIRAAKTAMRAKTRGLWKSLTWDDLLGEVRRFACGLSALGVAKGDTVAVIGNNSPRIFCAITSCQAIGAIPVPIYGSLGGDELADMLKETASRYVVAEDQQQVDEVLELRSRGISLEAVVYTVGRGMAGYDPDLAHDFEAIQKLGDEYESSHRGFYNDSVNAGSNDDPAMILFTPGVGHPKPVILCHRHILSVAEYVAESERVTDMDEVLSFMPISLPANLLCGYVLSHVTGMCLSCPESTETVMENLREIAPSLLYAPPHVYKRICSYIRERIEVTRGLSRKIYDRYMEQAARNKRMMFGEILVAAPIRELYGLNYLRIAFSGGDAINTDVFTFFDSLGVELKQIYGTTETFGCITIQVEERTEENVGHAVRDMEIKISSEGEILCKGRNVFSGYYKDEQATAEALDQDGWFHTGDIGTLSSDGRLTVLDSLSARGKLRDGTDFMPKIVEKAIKESLYIGEAFVSGDGEESLVAIVTIEEHPVSTWADHHDVRYTGYSDLALKEEVRELIKEQVAEANKRIAGRQPAISRFLIFNREMSLQTGELTWTNKMRRNVIREKFSGLLQALHSGQPDFEFNDLRNDNRIKFQISSF